MSLLFKTFGIAADYVKVKNNFLKSSFEFNFLQNNLWKFKLSKEKFKYIHCYEKKKQNCCRLCQNNKRSLKKCICKVVVFKSHPNQLKFE